jgi:hypothetical protein
VAIGETRPTVDSAVSALIKRRKEMTTGSPTRDVDLAERLWEETERIMRAETK